MVPTSVSPSTARVNGTAARSQISPSMSQISSPVPLRTTVARDGVSVRETMSLREINGKDSIAFRDFVSPPASRAPSQPPPSRPSPQASPQPRPSVSPSAPPLTESAANSMNRSMQEEFNELASSSLARSEDTTLRPRPPISAPFTKPIAAVYARSPARDVTNTSVFHSTGPSTADTILCDEVEHLERDLTDFSLSSIISVTKTHRGGAGTRRFSYSNHGSQSGTDSAVQAKNMIGCHDYGRTNGVFPHSDGLREHRKAQTHLSGGRRKEPLPDGPVVDDEKSFSANLAARHSKQMPVDWTAEAQEAYKLLVECGRDLTNTPSPRASPTIEQLRKPPPPVASVSPIPPRPVTPPHVKPRETTTTAATAAPDVVAAADRIEDVTSYSPQKRVHLIETKLLTTKASEEDRLPPGLPPKFDQKSPPGLPPKTRNIPVVMNGRSMNYDNLNGIGAGRAVPPPVPPKPKVTRTRPSSMSPPPQATATRLPLEKESPGFAPSITRGSLFSTSKKEEVIKF
ncbi:unnamed protein product [Heligmosomoides polygyrus]|uniref:Uncharacterized protein n=1 Tax=Heligmosomoides polygyrus TaxID=6339 RepID=A0A3P7XVQ0_HELPZ|nr:unnamed protein product [Heligmosomoides polygyrus]